MDRRILGYLVLITVLIIPVSGYSQGIGQVTAEGTCRDFTVTVSVENLTGCWDVKLDIPGQIEVSPGEWKSTFYYKDRAICYPETETVIRVKLENRESLVRGTAKIRQDTRVIEKGFEVVQDCPPEPELFPEEYVLLAAVVIVLVFGYGLVWWWRQGSEKGRSKAS